MAFVLTITMREKGIVSIENLLLEWKSGLNLEDGPGHPVYPFLSPEEKRNHTGAVVCFDATFPSEWRETAPKVVDFQHSWSKDIQQLVISRWKEYGFE